MKTTRTIVPTAARLLAAVGSIAPSAVLVIAVRGRQAPQLLWTPTMRIELG